MTAIGKQLSFLQLTGFLRRDLFLVSTQVMRLCKREMRENLFFLATNLCLVALGGVLALCGLLALLLAAAIVLGRWMDPAMAALVVGLGVIVLGGLLLLVGVFALRSQTFLPTESLEVLKEHAAWLKKMIS